MARVVYKCLPDMGKARNRVASPKTIREEIKASSEVKEFAKGRTYSIVTFGCQANVRDEEILSGYLEFAGFSKAKEPTDADFVIINTCAVRENAEEKVYGEIGRYKAKSLLDKNFVLAVCGCMMQEENVAKKIMASYPYVNLIFGTHNIHKILELLDEHLARKKDLVDIMSFQGDIIENLPSTRLDSYKAYVNITYGCDKFCTYCIVPYTRGRERSRSKEDILKECKELVEEGYQEITLLGQNVNSYGKDFKDGTSFATILEEVAKLGIPRLRFMTSHPWDFSQEMIDVIAKYPNIMNSIHLPVQSGSSSMLQRMGRRYTRESYLDLVRRLREAIPDVSLSTDIIVGFPNETEEEFQDTLTLAKEVKYNAAFTFIYSPRKGTPAAKLVDNVDDTTKHRRFDELLKVIEEGVTYHSAKMLGKEYSVLVDGPSKKDKSMLSGYTENGKLVHFLGPSYLKGAIVKVRIVEDHAFSMKGELLDDPILVLAKKAKAALAKEEAVIRYKSYKEKVDSSSEIKNLREEIESSQRKMVVLASEGKGEEAAKEKAHYEALMDEYKNHPLILNLASAGDELENLLLEVEGYFS
ncbi:MAG: tRNA (N6-isopentenyl adenosine(37)-C2)-methylthiotransferase MiaB [Bacilli bacterium]|nr:tRNA (N6-isopentenyl adenosine(37)-C2)-methylthiotransferase MiaB [Bacilli bacterium]